MTDKYGQNVEVGDLIRVRHKGKVITMTIRQIMPYGQTEWFAWADDGKPEITNQARNGMKVRLKLTPEGFRRYDPSGPKPMEQVRTTYRVPVKRGQPVEVHPDDGSASWRGKVSSAVPNGLRVDGKGPFHPVRELVFLSDDGNVLIDRRPKENP